MDMKNLLQDVLDELVAPRTSTARVGIILGTLEGILAEICVQKDTISAERLRTFTALQDTFECNVPSRILTWMSSASSRLESITGDGSSDHSGDTEATTLSSQLIQALSIMQGVALTHNASKSYLGRRYPLKVFLDLLLTSRHVEAMPLTASTNIISPPSSPESSSASRSQKPNPSSVPLASAVLDTLLCVLVDSSPALRVFEEQNGVQAVVRILKRAGTPREVRMKCLEFLYFYLLDETTVAGTLPQDPSQLQSTSASSTLVSRSPPAFKPSHRSAQSFAGSIDFSLTSSPSSSFNASLSASAPISFSSLQAPPTPSYTRRPTPDTPTSATPPPPALLPSPRIITPPTSRALLMLRKDVDYTPQSPKKPPVPRLGVGTRPGSALRAQARSRGASDREQGPDTARARGAGAGARTMEEKREILGGMLGNVDALVEGVRKAGIWGLG